MNDDLVKFNFSIDVTLRYNFQVFSVRTIICVGNDCVQYIAQ